MSHFRYLLHLSYIGTTFRGAQRQIAGRDNDPYTVQGQLEMALKTLMPINDPIVVLSSRTDSGVHAMNTTCHVDLTRYNLKPFDPEYITGYLNKCLKRYNVAIRVLKTYLIPNNVHCRHNAISRTYLYRLGVFPHTFQRNFQPVEELFRSYYILCDNFNVEEMKSASKLFQGTHDFRTFMARAANANEKITRRHLIKVDIKESKCLTYSPYSIPSFIPNVLDGFQFFDMYFQGTGFVYRQVRRMVSSLIAVAQGKISSSDIKLMLEVPSHHSWDPKVQTVPAHGLYLCEVEYSESDKQTFRDSLL